jgi:hypothetical protein
MVMTDSSNPLQALRPLFSLALLGYVALRLFFSFLYWIGGEGSLSMRSFNADFVGVFNIAFPLLAVLIVALVQPRLAFSKTVAAVALVEYLVALFLGLIAYLIGLGFAASQEYRYARTATPAIGLVQHTVMGAAELALMGLAAFAVLRVFLAVGGRLPDIKA